MSRSSGCFQVLGRRYPRSPSSTDCHCWPRGRIECNSLIITWATCTTIKYSVSLISHRDHFHTLPDLQRLEAESLIEQAQELLRQSRALYDDGSAQSSWTKVPMSFVRQLWNVGPWFRSSTHEEPPDAIPFTSDNLTPFPYARPGSPTLASMSPACLRGPDSSSHHDPIPLQLPDQAQPDPLSPGMQPQPHPMTTTECQAQPLMPQFHLTPVATASSFRTPGTQTAPSTPLSHTLTRQASDHSMDMSPPSTPAQVAIATPPSAAAEPQLTPRTRMTLMAGLLTGMRERFGRGRRGRGILGTPRSALAATRQRSLSEDAGLRRRREAAAESALEDLDARWHGGRRGGTPRRAPQLGTDSRAGPGCAGMTAPAARRLHCSSPCGRGGCCWCGGPLCSHGVPGWPAVDVGAPEGGASTLQGVPWRRTGCSAICVHLSLLCAGDWPSLCVPGCGACMCAVRLLVNFWKPTYGRRWLERSALQMLVRPPRKALRCSPLVRAAAVRGQR